MGKGVKIAIVIVCLAILAGAIFVYRKQNRLIVSPVPNKDNENNDSGFPRNGIVVTESTALNVRQSEGEADGETNTSTAISCLNKGDSVTIERLSGNKQWGYVPERGGWVSMNYIKLQ